MKLCLDSSTAIKWVLPEDDSPLALALRDDFRKGILDLIAPDVLPVEVAHALTRAERKGVLQVGEALPRLAAVMSLPTEFYDYLPLLASAVELSSSERVGVYDCLYIALSIREQCKVVTADQKMINTFPDQTVSLHDL